MLKRQLGTLFLVTCLILITTPAVLGAQNKITVSPTSGADAQTAINSAINSVASGATSNNPGYVLLTAGTYEISAPIVMKSNVILKGAGDNTIIYADGSVCNSDGEPGYIYGSGVSNVEICNLQFKSSASQISDGGHGDYRNCIRFASSTNCNVHDILFSPHLYSDGVRISKSTGINVYNCRIRSGHDGISFLSDSSRCRAYNNDIEITVNTGIRVDNGQNIELDHNTMYGDHGSGWCCFEMESSLSDIKIHHNILHDYQGSSGNAAVQPVHASGDVSVHNNVLWNVGSISMGSGSDNVISPSNQNVAYWVAKGYGHGSVGKTYSTKTDSKNEKDKTNATKSLNETDETDETDEVNAAADSKNTNESTKVNDSTKKNDSVNANDETDENDVTNLSASEDTADSTETTTKLLVADFSSIQISGKKPLTVEFKDKSTGSPTSWCWNFGDKSISTAKNPTHKYTKTGKYTVTLTVKNAACTKTVKKTNYIIVK
jgi:PKD repeat protein